MIELKVSDRISFKNKAEYLKPYFNTGDIQPAVLPHKTPWTIINQPAEIPTGWIVWSMKLTKNSSGCNNSISLDGMEIKEQSPQDHTGYDYLWVDDPKTNRFKATRVVFTWSKEEQWMFRGVFVPNREKSCDGVQVFQRVATSIRINNDPDMTIELLDYDMPESEEDRINRASQIEAEIDDLQLVGESKEAIVKVRVNQGEFRNRLLKRYQKCCLCGVSNTSLLVASHIKPWCDSEPKEKLDVDNGFLMCPNHDKLFDGGLISFNDEGKIIISPFLNRDDREIMRITSELSIELTEGNKKYLVFHRENVLKQDDCLVEDQKITPEHSGFEAPVKGVTYPQSTKLVKNEDGTVSLIPTTVKGK